MARLIRYQPNRRGIRDLGHSAGVIADLVGRAGRVAAVAQVAFDADPPNTGEVSVEVLPVDLDSPDERARVAVLARHPAALRIEAKRRPLGGALDAARG